MLELDVNENEISAGKSEPQLAQVEEFFLSPVGLENVTVDVSISVTVLLFLWKVYLYFSLV